ncbi:uncharacterized protein LOC123548840 [Mercenaria mercenaria]|uniref:uncharacterized protein LOC123548840 n=1 Tax=Mercenaria mercenaria TaxID=6596 RepID=UPI00234F071A|nr:uncharacterized protein LOC123548840 [Mercenaria mercenaria]
MANWNKHYFFLSILFIHDGIKGIDGHWRQSDTGLQEHFLNYAYNRSSHDITNNDYRSSKAYTETRPRLHDPKETDYAENDHTISKQVENNHKFNHIVLAKREISVVSLKDRKEIETTHGFHTKSCSINVAKTSIRYFQNILKTGPQFVQLNLTLVGNSTYRNTSSVFKPFRWSWTPNTTAGPYPFLSWNIDYGLLSFGLLEPCTKYIPYIILDIEGDCNLTFGTPDTSFRITKALGQMLTTPVINHSVFYAYSYFCFLRVREELLNTATYYASLYIIFPIGYISYDCCTAIYDWNNETRKYNCTEKTPGLHFWEQTTLLPFLVGLLILVYFPIYLCDVLAWMSKREHVSTDNENGNGHFTNRYTSLENEDDWVFENGESPLTFCELLGFSVFGLEKSHPILVSRLRRFICHLLIPSVIYFQILLYKNGIGPGKENRITVKDLVDVGTPMGFLSVLGSPEYRNKVFVPYLGGPVGIIVIYYILGILFVVFPRSLKQIIEDGLPSGRFTNEIGISAGEQPEARMGPPDHNHSLEDGIVTSQLIHSHMRIKSPLFFGNGDIVKASMVNIRPDQLQPGYTKAATLMRCSIYMLFTKLFWSQVVGIQSSRISHLIAHAPIYKKVFALFILPMYVVLCVFETICCIIYYGIPFCFYVVVVVKGASTGLVYLKEQIKCLSFIFEYRIFTLLCVSFVFVLSSVYAYIVALIFLKSFGILSQIFVLCFISVIMYPSYSFGYIFFFTASLYFCFRQIRQFGEVYTNLLSTAVEISDSIEGYANNVSFSNGRLSLSNVRYENLKDIRINGKLLDVSQNMLRTVFLHENLKIREKNNILGIPRKLFEHLIKKFRPIHHKVLSLVFKVAAMAALITVTLSITSDYVQGPTSEISEVMHVIFIIAVGTLPELIEVTVSYRDDENVEKEIEKRKIEQAIRDFWRDNNDILN